MTNAECINGATVICRNTSMNCKDRVGTLANVVRDPSGIVTEYQVLDSSGIPIGYRRWNIVGSWDLHSLPAETAKPLSPECPCGIMRVDCDYHKP